jgi:heavy metal translocating P-type ATPase
VLLKHAASWWPRIQLFGTIAIALLAVILLLAGQSGAARWSASGFAAIVALVQFAVMIRQLMRGRIGIDLLAITAIVSTVLVGEYWASLVVVFMLAGGRELEAYAGRRARSDLTALLARAPQNAHRKGNDGSISEVPLADVMIGDNLVVHPGEVVPVDGMLISPIASFDTSSLTGESLPVENTKDDVVPSGIVNLNAAVEMRAVAVAADSQYQGVVNLMQAAAESRAPLVRLADRYAVPFTVVSFVIAGAAWLMSGDPVRFAEVVVVATPCPLLIAAPVAFVAGVSRAARMGIIVKGGGAIEVLSRVRTVAFDKTGTVTVGHPSVVDVNERGGFSRDDVLALAASGEQYSGHVLAQSIVEAAQQRGLGLRRAIDIQETTAGGIVAVVEGRTVTVGKRSFLEAEGIAVAAAPPRDGTLVVHLGVDGQYAGQIVLADAVRVEAAATIKQLSRLGIVRTLLVTGDALGTAQYVADAVGLDEVHAECSPADKVAEIRSQHARPVMMVGDGVNDAPVLAAADIGLAMGATGATAASEAADVVILVDDLSRVVQALSIGRQTTAVALQAIWVGIALSVALMIVASTGLIPAIVGAGLQEVVDVATIASALRALQNRPDRALTSPRTR